MFVVLALVAWKAGGPVARTLLGILSSAFATVFGSSGAMTADPSSLRAAIRNVTTDYDQVLRRCTRVLTVEVLSLYPDL